MRVLRGVVHTIDLQCVAKFYFAKKNYFSPLGFVFRTALSDLRTEICIES